MREALSKKYISGSGIEIGANHYPLPIAPGVKVTYVDLMDADELQNKFPEISVKKLDIVIDNGERLTTFTNESQDFVIANHVFEHCENPIETFWNWLRVLKPGGIIFAAIPDKEQCFDRKREVTPYWHLLKDYRDGPDWSLEGHYRDWYVNSELEGKLIGEPLEKQIREAVIARQNIHFHVWNESSLRDTFDQFKVLFKLNSIEIYRNGSELIIIARK